jgi:signal transduction histidine kinase
MFELREQLKKQFKETQRAQQKEKRASDLNKRFISYSTSYLTQFFPVLIDLVFHEVRVPLNTALLSVQNLEADDVFRNLPPSQEECVLGLSSSLALMEKVNLPCIYANELADMQVLNDVLSFNRMESGNFTQAKAPFDFHRQMAMCASSHHAQAQAKDLAIITDLDKRIDELGHTLIGDEMRLRQVTW